MSCNCLYSLILRLFFAYASVCPSSYLWLTKKGAQIASGFWSICLLIWYLSVWFGCWVQNGCLSLLWLHKLNLNRIFLCQIAYGNAVVSFLGLDSLPGYHGLSDSPKTDFIWTASKSASFPSPLLQIKHNDGLRLRLNVCKLIVWG